MSGESPSTYNVSNMTTNDQTVADETTDDAALSAQLVTLKNAALSQVDVTIDVDVKVSEIRSWFSIDADGQFVTSLPSVEYTTTIGMAKPIGGRACADILAEKYIRVIVEDLYNTIYGTPSVSDNGDALRYSCRLDKAAVSLELASLKISDLLSSSMVSAGTRALIGTPTPQVVLQLLEFGRAGVSPGDPLPFGVGDKYCSHEFSLRNSVGRSISHAPGVPLPRITSRLAFSVIHDKTSNTLIQSTVSPAVYEQGVTPVASSDAPGWYYKKVSGQSKSKIFWVFAPSFTGQTVADITGLFLKVLNISTTSNDYLPFLHVYTKPKGDGLDGKSWARSVRTYIFDQTRTPVARTSYTLILDLSARALPEISGERVNLQLTDVGTSNAGPFESNEEIYFFAIGTDSGAPIDSVDVVVDQFGIIGKTLITEYNFRF